MAAAAVACSGLDRRIPGGSAAKGVGEEGSPNLIGELVWVAKGTMFHNSDREAIEPWRGRAVGLGCWTV